MGVRASDRRALGSDTLRTRPFQQVDNTICTLDSRGFRHCRGFRDFRESSTQLLVCSCLSCLRRFLSLS